MVPVQREGKGCLPGTQRALFMKIEALAKTVQLGVEYFCELEYLTSALLKKQIPSFPLNIFRQVILCFLPWMSETLIL